MNTRDSKILAVIGGSLLLLAMGAIFRFRRGSERKLARIYPESAGHRIENERLTS